MIKIVRKTFILLFLTAIAFSQVFVKPADIHESNAFHKPFETLIKTSRPSRTNQYLTPGGHFIIHYDNSGFNEVPQDYTYNDSIPDFVYKAAEYLDASYDTLRALGFDAPPIDNIESPEIDIYFRYDRSYYGVTYPENNQSDGSWTSYLTLSTQLEDSTVFYTYGLEGLRVTCAHELFHIFQLGYKYRSQDIFYFEMSSVWFEEYMYPEVNDYHAYVNEYAQDWNYAINHSALDYDNAGFNLYINKRFSRPGNNIIHSIWDRILFTDALSSIRNELEYRGIAFENALRDWGTAQVLCDIYSADNFQYPFNDAEELNTISFQNNTSNILTTLSADFTAAHDPMTTYFKITGTPGQIMLFETMLDEGTSANLICLSNSESEVRRIGNDPMIIDGRNFSEYILVLGSDAVNAGGSYAFTAIEADEMASVYPNPLPPGQALNISYVLLENNQEGIISIYDLKGRKVFSRNLGASLLTAGLHEISFIPTELTSGIYIAALHLDGSIVADKFTFIK